MPLIPIDHAALADRLVRAGGVDLEGRGAVQPVVGAAQAQPLRADQAQVRRREGLAQRAGVELVDRLVGQIGQAAVAVVVGRARLVQPFLEAAPGR